jgi:hypothetical protein
MTVLTAASTQWATRPADQRFTSLTSLHEHVSTVRDRSHAKALSSRALTAVPVEGDHRALAVVGPNGGPVDVTHWAFTQLAQRAGAPAGYLRELPGAMAADCLNYGLHHKHDSMDLGVLLYQNGGPAELRAITGPNYGRIWNTTITKALHERFGDGVTGDFRVPGEFGEAVEIGKANTTLYASDRDMFVFLADEEHRIEVPNRRDGQPGSMARGFFVWNSEVGAQALGIATFLFDYVCKNRIVWGATGYNEVRIRHTSSAPHRWLEEVAPAIEAYAQSSTQGIQDGIAKARQHRIDHVDEFLAKRFTRSLVGPIKAAHMADEQRPIETLWDVVTGVTAHARGIQYQDERVKLEREAGKLMDAVAV